MIPLHGMAQLSHGIYGSPTFVVRMRAQFDAAPPSTADFALVRSKEELREAAVFHPNGIFFIGDGDDLQSEPGFANVPRLIGVSAKFDYFADGDIIGFHPQSKRFRTLYRRASQHNSFLVTNRCNHYCLMCSQPPKDIDDRWIFDEIRAAVPLIDKGTKSIGFTGGEPLLDWREFIEVLAQCRDELPETTIHVLSNG